MWTLLSMATLSGASLAIASITHCAVMCGPLAVASCSRGRGRAANYFVGRLVSYTMLGAIAGSFGQALTEWVGARWLEAALSWLLALVLLGAAWRHVAPRRSGAARREAADGATVQLRTRKPSRPLSRLLAVAARDPLLMGALTALLPCGALLSALMAAAALHTALGGAVAMGTFASITGLSLLGLSSLGARAEAFGVPGKRALALVLVVGAGILVWRPVPALSAPDGVPACHHHPAGGAEP